MKPVCKTFLWQLTSNSSHRQLKKKSSDISLTVTITVIENNEHKQVGRKNKVQFTYNYSRPVNKETQGRDTRKESGLRN